VGPVSLFVVGPNSLDTDGSAGSIAGCAFVLAGTLVSVGDGFQAASDVKGWLEKAGNGFGDSELDTIEMSVFQKRALQLDRQSIHEDIMKIVLRRSFDEPEFLGYVSDGHKLSRRDDEHLHPRPQFTESITPDMVLSKLLPENIEMPPALQFHMPITASQSDSLSNTRLFPIILWKVASMKQLVSQEETKV
jgi:hypothetical protein